MHMLRIGYHTSAAGSLDLAFDRAAAMGATAMQIFVSNPRGWKAELPAQGIIGGFARKGHRYDIEAVCHMPYLPNLASADPEKRMKSVSSLAANARICDLLGIRYLIAHLGSHLGRGAEEGIRNVIGALDELSDGTGKAIVLLENQAGNTNSVGSRLEDLARIYEESSLSRAGRLGFCLDTCHLFAAGYDIRREKILDTIGDMLDFGRVHVLHVNDAKFGLGSGRDRHDNIGQGFIGLDAFAALLNYNGIRDKILILETPWNPELADGEEMEMLRRLAR